jgi:hypothetical protein
MRLAAEIATLTLLLTVWEATRRRTQSYVRGVETNLAQLRMAYLRRGLDKLTMKPLAVEGVETPEALKHVLETLGLRMEDAKMFRVPSRSHERERLRRVAAGLCPSCGGNHPPYGSKGTEPTEEILPGNVIS